MTDETHIPPSQQLCQGPVPKPGEPIVWTKGLNAPPEKQEIPIGAKPSPPATKPSIIARKSS